MDNSRHETVPEAQSIEAFWQDSMSRIAGTVESLSGPGSTLSYTQGFRQGLENFIKLSRCRTFLDAPCGDFNWMKTVSMPETVEYIGGDIVSQLINSHSENHGAANRTFLRINIIADHLPDADIWLCRDCMFHLSLDQALRALKNSLRSNIRYYMMSSHFNETNLDIVAGGFRELNLTRAPFNLPPPLSGVLDYVEGFFPRQVGIWTRDQVLGAMINS